MPTYQVFGEAEHVDGGAPEPIQGGDRQGVTSMQRLQRLVESWSGCAGSADAVVDIGVVAADASSHQVGGLPVGRSKINSGRLGSGGEAWIHGGAGGWDRTRIDIIALT